MAKKRKIKVPDKISANQAKKENKKLKDELIKIKQSERNNFQTLFLLATNLYKLSPKHNIFINGTFKDEFIEMIKKSCEAQEKAKKETRKAAPAKDVPIKDSEGDEVSDT